MNNNSIWVFQSALNWMEKLTSVLIILSPCSSYSLGSAGRLVSSGSEEEECLLHVNTVKQRMLCQTPHGKNKREKEVFRKNKKNYKKQGSLKIVLLRIGKRKRHIYTNSDIKSKHCQAKTNQHTLLQNHVKPTATINQEST